METSQPLAGLSPRTLAVIASVAGVVLATAALIVVLAAVSTASAKPNAAPIPSGATVAFYGDSYTLGDYASSPAARWSSVLSRQQGWKEVNASIDGGGFAANGGQAQAVDKIIKAKPDLIIVTMGINDSFIADNQMDVINAAIKDQLTRLRAGAPHARLVVVQPFWIPEPKTTGYGLVAAATKAAAAKAGADYISGAGDWLGDRPEWRADDPYKHPNDAGYAELARRMTIALKQQGVIR